MVALAQAETVIDESKIKNYRHELPNIIDDFGLTPYEHRLYTHYKRSAGEAGSCTQGTRYIASLCKMSTGQVTNAKKKLIEYGLIWVKTVPSKTGDMHEVTLPDLWETNFKIYLTKDKDEREKLTQELKRSLYEHSIKRSQGEQERSQGEQERSLYEHQRSPHERRNKHIRKEPYRKEDIADASSDAPPTTQQSETQNPPLENEKSKIENDNSNPAIQEKGLETPPSSVAPPNPLPPLAPPGFRWLCSSVSDSLMHLIPTASNDRSAKALCKTNVPHRVAWSPLMDKQPCAECVRIAMEPPKPKTPERHPSSDLTDAMHGAIPDAIRPPGRPHYGKNAMPAKEVLEAGFTAQDVAEYVTWAYVHDKWYCCGGAGGMPVSMTMHDVKKNIKGWKSIQGKDSSNGHKPSVLGAGIGNRTKTDYGF